MAENLGAKYKTIARLLKRNWKIVGMAKETITDLVACIPPVFSLLRKNPGNWSKTFGNIEKY